MDGEAKESPISGCDSVLKPTDTNKTAEEKLVKATEYKLEGNVFFKQKDYKKAIRNYHRWSHLYKQPAKM